MIFRLFLVTLLLALVSLLNAQPSSRTQKVRYMSYAPEQQPRYGIPAYFRFLQTRVGPQKRNNAEVVNHILKNFGTLDRLGDVGK